MELTDKDKDWTKSTISTILSWGFPSVFVILGICLLALHKEIGISETTGIIVIALGVITYSISGLLSIFVKRIIRDNKALTNQVDMLNKEVKDLNVRIEKLQSENKDLSLKLVKLNTLLENKE